MAYKITMQCWVVVATDAMGSRLFLLHLMYRLEPQPEKRMQGTAVLRQQTPVLPACTAP